MYIIIMIKIKYLIKINNFRMEEKFMSLLTLKKFAKRDNKLFKRGG